MPKEREVGRLPLSAFPIRTDTTNKRIIYVQGLDEMIRNELERRGYSPIELSTLPRHDTQTEKDYLLAKCRALEEGTVSATSDDRRSLELAMRAAGMLRVSDTNTYSLPTDPAALETLLSWSASRHTLNENSTVQSAQRNKIELDDKDKK